jgi:hypothetical protein
MKTNILITTCLMIITALFALKYSNNNDIQNIQLK